MDDSLGKKIKVVADHFQASTSEDTPIHRRTQSSSSSTEGNSPSLFSHSLAQRKSRRASFMLNLFSLRGLPWTSSADGEEKIELTVAEVESLKSELADLEEKNAHLKAQLEQVDEILRSSRLSGYLYIRTRWTALPGEPPIDDTDVDDWLPRFVVLHGLCIFFYLLCTDLSPQDSTLLSDITEVGSMPSFTREEDEETRYCFYILTRQGLRFECCSASKMQVDSWLSTLQSDCQVKSETKFPKCNAGM